MELLSRTCNYDVMNVQRFMARAFLVVGAVFWGVSAWSAEWAYQGAPFTTALSLGLLYAGALVAVLVIGMFYETIAAVLLAVASAAVIVFGIVQGWETGVWATVMFFFVLPLVISAILYLLAASAQKRCEEQEQ